MEKESVGCKRKMSSELSGLIEDDSWVCFILASIATCGLFTLIVGGAILLEWFDKRKVSCNKTRKENEQ